MSDMKKRIAALTAVGVILSSCVGFSAHKNATNRGNKRGEYSLEELKDYYAVTINYTNGERISYLCKCLYVDNESSYNYMVTDNGMIPNFGTVTPIATESANNKNHTNDFKSDLGNVESTINFANLIVNYKDLKDTYSLKEMYEVFDAYTNDNLTFNYNPINPNKENNNYSNVNTLTKKK